MIVKHINNGNCLKCKEIMNRYPGLNIILVNWFTEFQKLHFEAHIAFAGRGKKDQEQAFKDGTSHAHYGQSAHNYNLAIDVFKLNLSGVDWSPDWYKTTLAQCVAMNHELFWGGQFANLVDRPHVEIKNWKELVKNGTVKLVE